MGANRDGASPKSKEPPPKKRRDFGGNFEFWNFLPWGFKVARVFCFLWWRKISCLCARLRRLMIYVCILYALTTSRSDTMFSVYVDGFLVNVHTLCSFLFRRALFGLLCLLCPTRFSWRTGAGLIKIRGDKVWKDLTAMDYHYETQPLPNPISYYLHQAPKKIHRHACSDIAMFLLQCLFFFYHVFLCGSFGRGAQADRPGVYGKIALSEKAHLSWQTSSSAGPILLFWDPPPPKVVLPAPPPVGGLALFGNRNACVSRSGGN